MGLETIRKDTFDNFDVSIYTKLMEDYDVQQASVSGAEMPADKGTAAEICACVDCKDSEVILAGLSNQSIYQFYADVRGNTDFLCRKLKIRGRHLAAGLGAGEMVYLFAIRENELYYCRETARGSNVFSDERKVKLGDTAAGKTLVQVLVKGVEDGLAVGLVTEDSNGYDFAYSFWDGQEEKFDTLFYRHPGGTFTFSGTDKDSLSILTLNAQAYERICPAGQKMVMLKGVPDMAVLDLKCSRWERGNEVTFALLGNGDTVKLGILKEEPGKKAVSVEYVTEQPGLESFLIADSYTKARDEIHLLALAGEVAYHAVAARSTDGKIIYGDFVPIGSSVADAAFTEDTEEKIGIYFAKKDRNVVNQLRYNRYTKQYNDHTLYLPGVGTSLTLSGATVRTGSCYSSEVTFTDKNGAPLQGKKVIVWSREEMYLETVSGMTRLNEDSRRYLETDVKGSILLKQQVSSLDGNEMFLFLEGFMNPGAVIRLRQMDMLENRFQSLTVEELQNAKTQDGYLLPDSIRKDAAQVKALVDPIKEAAGYLPRAPLGQRGIYLIHEGENLETGRVSFPEEGRPWRLSFPGGKPEFCWLPEGEAAELLKGPQEADSLFKTCIGDLFWGTRESIIAMDSITVGGGYASVDFWLNGIRHVCRFLINSIAEIFNVVEMIFNKVKVPFKKLFEWLGFLFDWDDILRYKEAAKYMLQKSGEYMSRKADLWSGEICGKLEEIRRTAHASMEKMKGIGAGEGFFKYTKEQEHVEPQYMEAVSNDFITSKFLHEVQYVKLGDVGQLLNGEARDEIENLVEVVERYTGTVGQDPKYTAAIKNLKEAYADTGSLYENPLSAFIEIMDTLTQLVLSGVEELVRAAFGLVKTLVDALFALAREKISIPYVSGFYEHITGQEMTLLDITALVMAIPSTVTYKLLYGKSPFPDDASLKEFRDKVDQVLAGTGQGLMQGGDAALKLLEICSITGLFGGMLYYMFSAFLDGGVGDDSMTMAVLSLLFEMAWTVGYAPYWSGPAAWQSAAVFYLGCVGFCVDTSMTCYYKKHVDKVNYGPAYTTVYGIVHLILSGIYVFSKVPDIRGDQVVNAVCPCFPEGFKVMLMSEIPELIGLECLLDALEMFVIVVTGLWDLIASVKKEEVP